MFERLLAVTALSLFVLLAAGTANADPRTSDIYSHSGEYKNKKSKRTHTKRSRARHARSSRVRTARRGRYRSSERSSLGYNSGVSYSTSHRYNAGRRPGRWCGWWMRTQRGGGPEFNVAWNWRKYGRPASAQVGAVVVWRHHVGQIVGRTSSGRWIIQSGNDGGRVRTRPRSVAGAIFRM